MSFIGLKNSFFCDLCHWGACGLSLLFMNSFIKRMEASNTFVCMFVKVISQHSGIVKSLRLWVIFVKSGNVNLDLLMSDMFESKVLNFTMFFFLGSCVWLF